ncbi:class I SAM-dependent methyltransferase [Streptomyces sp. NPDC085540]|uniref:class I SAM-dependent methyltransferase n=1 Tax=Streptomyces sp. NPDC085540 TaxID=3365730 RepID=UPI0037CDA0F9
MGTVGPIGLPDASAGSVVCVVCVDALGHASDPVAALAEFRRLLTPGARAVVTAAVHRDTGPSGTTGPRQRGVRSSTSRSSPTSPRYGAGSTSCGRRRPMTSPATWARTRSAPCSPKQPAARPTLDCRREVALTLRRPLRCTDAPTTLESR